MRLFYEKIFDGYIAGTQNVYTQASHAQLLGSSDIVTVTGLVTAATGTSPTLSCQFEQSPDGIRWANQTGSVELNAMALALLADNPVPPFINTSAGLGGICVGYARLRIALGGTSPTGLLQLFASGRTF